jgi:hypothetical protein
LVRAADRVEHRESGMIRVAMTYRLCSPPRFETVSRPLSRLPRGVPLLPRRLNKELGQVEPGADRICPSRASYIGPTLGNPQSVCRRGQRG